MTLPAPRAMHEAPGLDERPIRPAAVDAVAALFVFGGLFGLTQLAFGDFVITGQLPAKGPILGVAAILYAASIALGIGIRTGRAWLAALNLAVVFAIVYVAAFGRPVSLGLGVAHGVAAVLLIRVRPWFAAMTRWRNPLAGAGFVPPLPVQASRRSEPRPARRGGRRRPSARR
ncbi:MAG: hypothetical protein ABI573_09375 [Chloroflexota bacterium]